MKRTTQYISILLLGLILINAFSITLVKVHYELNKDFIIANYCVNVDVPELKCEGKCHLNESLEALSEKNTNSEAPITNNLNFISTEFFTSGNDFSSFEELVINTFHSTYSNHYTFLSLTSIDKPPFS